MSKSSFGKIGCALICSASLGLNATAQDQSSQQTGRTVQQAGQAGQQAGQLQGAGQQQGAAMQSQNMIASCLVHDNQAEIALGRMAQEKAESGAVKKFAGMMVQEHQEFLTKLQRFAPNAGELSAQHSEGSGQSGSEGGQRGQNRDGQDRGSQNQPGKNQSGQGQSGQGQSGQGQSGLGQVSQPQGSNLNAAQMGDPSMLALKIQREVAQQCLSDSQAKLAKQDGDKFDKCYVGMQIVAHAGMKSKLTVFSRHAQGELKQLIDQGLQTTEKHLDEAESIMKDLDKSSDASETARRSNDKSDSTNK